MTGCRFGALSRFSYYFYVYRMARFRMSRDEWWYDWDRGTLPFRLNNEHHPHDHYYPLSVANEQLNTDVLPEQLKKLIADESQHFTTRHIACMQGFDCSSPDPRETRADRALPAVGRADGPQIVQDSLENYMRQMMAEVKDPEVLTGESRNPGATGKWTHLMGDVISSRMKIKRRNSQVETALQRRAEPFSALGWLSGGEYMTSAIDRAWRYLMQNHPHDTICGAGVDQMEKDMRLPLRPGRNHRRRGRSPRHGQHPTPHRQPRRRYPRVGNYRLQSQPAGAIRGRLHDDRPARPLRLRRIFDPRSAGQGRSVRRNPPRALSGLWSAISRTSRSNSARSG